MSFDRIPLELRQRVQWCVWRLETPYGSKPTKIPYNPKTGFNASATDRNTWASFDEAVHACMNSNGRYNGIGFFFAKNDPYCGIDLDDCGDDAETFARQKAIHEYLNSYSEFSPSGKGLHVIVRASVPHGRKRSHIEIYSQDRYFTFTGNVYHDAPIADRQAEVMEIWSAMSAAAEPSYYEGDFIERADDATIWQMAADAKNGDLFKRLWEGDWSGYPPNADASGSSEADFALVDILAYYTKNRVQIQRMFEASALGKRAKYAKASPGRRSTLIGYMINKSFDTVLPDVDISAITNKVNEALAVPSSAGSAPANTATAHTPIAADRPAGLAADPAPPPSPIPPISHHGTIRPFTVDGYDVTVWKRFRPPEDTIIGAIAKYIYEASPRPVYEISLAAALGFMAGMCGRSYNVSKTGLNHYIMLIAPTGSGKEAMDSGISRLVEAVASGSVTGRKNEAFRGIVGPADMGSGQGLLKHLAAATTPCYLSIMGEIGLRLQQICSPRANNAESQLLRVLLDLFNKSGAEQSVKGTVYSDQKNNTEMIYSPAFSLLGESVPDTFYRSFDENAIASGLLPRITIIEYDGPRVPFNRDAEYAKPPQWLISFLDQFYTQIMERMQKGQVVHIGFTPEADAFQNQISAYTDDKINGVTDDTYKQLWNRVHVKALKTAALLAISNNPNNPQITKFDLEWALSLSLSDTYRLIGKFQRGEMGTNNEVTEQEQEIRRAIKLYLTSDVNALKTYKVRPDMHFDRIVPYSYLAQRCVAYAAFRNSKIGAINAIKQAIQTMIDKGYLQDASTQQLRQKYGITSMKIYAPIDPTFFLD